MSSVFKLAGLSLEALLTGSQHSTHWGRSLIFHVSPFLTAWCYKFSGLLCGFSLFPFGCVVSVPLCLSESFQLMSTQKSRTGPLRLLLFGSFFRRDFFVRLLPFGRFFCSLLFFPRGLLFFLSSGLELAYMDLSMMRDCLLEAFTIPRLEPLCQFTIHLITNDVIEVGL